MELVKEPGTDNINSKNETHFCGNDEKFLTFALGDGVYGIEILKVREIIGMMPITDVPQAPLTLKGIINLRGQIIPISDLRLLFGMSEKERDRETCIIIVDINGKLAGIIVDTVSEVINVNSKEVESGPDLDNKLKTDFILGISKLDEKIRTLIAIDKVLGIEDLKY